MYLSWVFYFLVCFIPAITIWGSLFLRPWVQTRLTPLTDKIALGFSPWNGVFLISVFIHRPLSVRSLCDHHLMFCNFRSVLFALTVQKAVAFAHIALKMHSEIVQRLFTSIVIRYSEQILLICFNFFLADIKDEYFYPLNLKRHN